MATRGPDQQPRRRRWDRGPLNSRWKGGTRLSPQGYVDLIGAGGGRGKHRKLHIVVAERVLGHSLPVGAVVHHVDENKQNSANSNLVILQSAVEDNELHRKMRVRAAGGDPWRDRMCCSCGMPKPAEGFYFSHLSQRFSSECKPCARVNALSRQAVTL